MSRVRPHSRAAARADVWIAAATGCLLVALAAAGAPALAVAVVGAVAYIAGVLLARQWNSADADRLDQAAVPIELRNEAELARLYGVVRDVLVAVAVRPDGVVKEAVTQRLVGLGVQFRAVAAGTGFAASSDVWHVAHDAVLAVPELKEYRAVVRVRDAAHVAGPAERESLHATFAAAHRGVLVERVLVLPEVLWPSGRLLPADAILPWLEEQHNHGVRLILLREGQLGREDPLADTCAFSDWAVGTRDVDGAANTTRVALDFTPDTVRAALDRLDHVSQIGISFRDLLARAEGGG
jgi:hypothetical protein